MTIDERARKIFYRLERYNPQALGASQKGAIDFIAAQLREVKRDHGKSQFERGCEDGFKDGFNAAKEKATEIVLTLDPFDKRNIAERIRAIEP